MKFTTKTANVIDYNDLDDAITDFLQKKGVLPLEGPRSRYECVAYEEWGNYESHEFDVDPKDVDHLKPGDRLHYQTSNILNWMCFEGLLPAGDLTVSISW